MCVVIVCKQEYGNSPIFLTYFLCPPSLLFLYPEVPAEKSPRRRSISGTSGSEKANPMDSSNTSPFKVPVSTSFLRGKRFFVFEIRFVAKQPYQFGVEISTCDGAQKLSSNCSISDFYVTAGVSLEILSLNSMPEKAWS